MIKNILFDLDGTLLPMDQDIFIEAYLRTLSAHLAPHGYDAKQLVKGIWTGTGAMIKNDGSQTNEQAFWACFDGLFERDTLQDEPLFDRYYRTDFSKVRLSCGFTPEAKTLIASLKAMGFRLILATNPIFPAIATQNRIAWAGLSPQDFEHITTYENSHFCKPNPDYYREIFQTAGLRAEECLMVGNDAAEDMVAKTLGCEVFLVTTDLINKQNLDLSGYRQGSLADVLPFVQSLI